MKTENFRNALNLSAEELVEVSKVKAKLNEIAQGDVRISEVRAGFQFLDVEIYDYPKNCTFRVKEDVSISVHTSIGLVEVGTEIGKIILNAIKEKQEKGEFINVKLLPL